MHNARVLAQRSLLARRDVNLGIETACSLFAVLKGCGVLLGIQN